MVFDSLQPDPVVDAVKTVSLVNESRDEIVIGEVGVEDAPRGKDAFPEKKCGKRSEECALEP